MITASTSYLKLLRSILEETAAELGKAIDEMAGCDYDAIDLDPENIAAFQYSNFNLVSQIQNQLRECTIKSYANMLDIAEGRAISDRNKVSK